MLEDFSLDSIRQQTIVLKRFEREILNFPASADREIVLGNIRSSLLDIESIRGWEKNPDLYSSTASNAVFVIMSRNFAPQSDRLKSVIARERQMPKMFETARANLKNPPRVYTEVALEQLPGIVSFFQKDVPLAFGSVKDPALLDQFHEANARVVRELQRYEAFLKNDLLPRSKGDFRIGAENYRKKLLYDEMVDIPPRPSASNRVRESAAKSGRRSARPRKRSIRARPRGRFWMRRRKIIHRRISCWTLFATRWVACGLTSLNIANRNDSVACHADRGGNTAVYAGADDCVHGYTGPL